MLESDHDAMDVDKAVDVASGPIIFNVDDFQSEDEDVETERIGKGNDRSPAVDHETAARCGSGKLRIPVV